MPKASRSTPATIVGADSFTIEPKGPFSLEEAAMFGFGQRHDDRFDGTMRLAFCLDGYTAQAGVAVTQDPDGIVRGTIVGAVGDPSGDAVIAQVARVLSLDKDATGYVALGDDDPVIARLLAAAPGLRPPLFYSPYEATLWAVLSARRPRRTGDAWRTKLSKAIGARFEVGATEMWSVPLPDRILEIGVDGVRGATGIEEIRAERVITVAQAASEGKLDADKLAAAGQDVARATLRSIPGIGPFYADLVLLRATGITDMFPGNEPRLLGLLGELYGFAGPATPTELAQLGERWSPWRTWVSVLVRASGPRVLGHEQGPMDHR